MRLWTSGSTGRTPEGLIETCKRLGIGLVADVRWPGGPPRWSRDELGLALEIAGLRYQLLPALSPPPGPRGETAATARDRLRRYRDHALTDPAPAAALLWLESLLSQPPPPPSGVLLLGTPAGPSLCHRSVIAARLRERLPGLQVTHL